jgi:hypothetical protein
MVNDRAGEYKTDFFQRAVVLNSALLAEGTYKRGQLLGPPVSGYFPAYSGSGAVGAVCVNDITLDAPGHAAIARGEFEKEGVVAVNAGLPSAVTVDDEVIAACFMAGIILN